MDRIIQTPVKTRFAVERFEYLLICKRNEKAAKILALLEMSHGQKVDDLDSRLFNDPRYKITDADYKQHYTRKQLNLYSLNNDYNKIQTHLDFLAKQGFVNVERTHSGNVATGYSILFNQFAVQTAVNAALEPFTVTDASGKSRLDQKKYFEWYYQKSIDSADLLPENEHAPMQNSTTPPIHLNLPPNSNESTPPIHLNLPPNSNELTDKTIKRTISFIYPQNQNFEKIEGFSDEKTLGTDFVQKEKNSAKKESLPTEDEQPKPQNILRRVWNSDGSKMIDPMKIFYAENEAYKNTVLHFFERFKIDAPKNDMDFNILLDKLLMKFASNLIKKRSEDFYTANNQTQPFSTYASLLDLHGLFLGALTWLGEAVQADARPEKQKSDKAGHGASAAKSPVSVVRAVLTTKEEYKAGSKFDSVKIWEAKQAKLKAEKEAKENDKTID